MSLQRESSCSEEAEDSQACASLQSSYRLCYEEENMSVFSGHAKALGFFFPERNKDFVLPEGEELSWEGRQNCYVMLKLWLQFNT